MNLILLGNQASGKGTQGELLAKKINFFYISTGQLFRKLAESDAEIAETINSGQLLPDELVFKCIKSFFEEKQQFDNIILDGSPRSVDQFNFLSEWLASKGKKIDMAILLVVSKEEAIRRISSRRTDKKTGKVYNLITNPPGPEVDPSDLVQRVDSTQEAVEERFREYENVTKPLIEKLREKGILFEVNGERPIEEIHEDILKTVTEQLSKNEQN